MKCTYIDGEVHSDCPLVVSANTPEGMSSLRGIKATCASRALLYFSDSECPYTDFVDELRNSIAEAERKAVEEIQNASS